VSNRDSDFEAKHTDTGPLKQNGAAIMPINGIHTSSIIAHQIGTNFNLRRTT